MSPRRARRAGLLVLVGLLAWSSAAGATEPAAAASVAEARSHFEAGRRHYEERRFREAIAEFQAGQALAPRPQFLLNIGQAHRQLFELEEARRYYRAYLEASPADDPERGKVEALIAEIDRALEAQRARPQQEAARPVEDRGARARVFLRRHWWIIPVSAVALTGIGLGLYFGLRSSGGDECAKASFGCLDTLR